MSIGHGGAAVSQYLHNNLHQTFETLDTKSVPNVVAAIKAYGGYFRRFRGGALEPWAQSGWDLDHDEHTEMNLTLEAYATLAFLQARFLAQSILVALKRFSGRH